MTTMIGGGRIQTKCDQCGNWDDHAKVVAFEGWRKHHDCLAHGDKVSMLAGVHSQHPLITARIVEACERGTRGGDLLEFIQSQQMKDYGNAEMITTGLDSAMENAIVTALTPTTGTATVGTVTVTAPNKVRFDSVMTTTDSGASTEWTTSGGYTAGGVSIGANWAAASGGVRASSADVTVTSAPAQTWAGNEIWDSSGTPLRSFWGVVTGGSKTVNSGDTCKISSGSLTVALAGH